MPSFKVVIPARYGSTRLPSKPLLPIAGRPMVAHVCERALESGADEVIVASDDERIARAVQTLPVRAVLTRPEHSSGTERIVEVANILGWDDLELIVNLQGDEPLMDPRLIRRLAEGHRQQQHSEVATLAAPIGAPEEVFNPHAVKVVLDRNGYALYFSRAPIPWFRDGFSKSGGDLPEAYPYLRHIGIYAYTAGFLRRYAAWPPSPIEGIESLEQLRILWHGERIYVLVVERAPIAGVDTEADHKRVVAILDERARAVVPQA